MIGRPKQPTKTTPQRSAASRLRQRAARSPRRSAIPAAATGFNVWLGEAESARERTTFALRIYNLLNTVYATSPPYPGQWMLGMPRTAELSINEKF
jgi:hypothetical protein